MRDSRKQVFDDVVGSEAAGGWACVGLAEAALEPTPFHIVDWPISNRNTPP